MPLAAAPAARAALCMAATALPDDEKVAFILLAGGSGSRMKADRPKQFLELRDKPVLAHSLELLLGSPALERLVLVIANEFRSLDFLQPVLSDPRVVCADPGAERQDSVRSGLASVPPECTLVAVHDAARPLVTLDAIDACLCDAATHGAAVLAVPMKATVKESTDGAFVSRTLERSTLWEIQTPQVIRPQLLRDGFEKVDAENLEVTDDVSIVELLGEPVKLTMGEYTNLKLTTPEDMVIAETILSGRGE
jgi:2-C-methyl-D-erythritol 4-phosphate cytidylyltransferase